MEIGDHGDKFYIILEGTVTVSIMTADLELSQIATLSAGQAFGELALTDKFSKRKATIRCTSDCIFAVLHVKEFSKVLGTLVSKRR